MLRQKCVVYSKAKSKSGMFLKVYLFLNFSYAMKPKSPDSGANTRWLKTNTNYVQSHMQLTHIWLRAFSFEFAFFSLFMSAFIERWATYRIREQGHVVHFRRYVFRAVFHVRQIWSIFIMRGSYTFEVSRVPSQIKKSWQTATVP